MGTVSFLFDGADCSQSASHGAKVSAKGIRLKRNTKVVGDRSELEVALALARLGYIVSKPLGDSHRYDLIIDDGVTLSRVQVKTGKMFRGSVRFNCYSTHLHRGGVACRSYRGEVEFIAVYCPQTRGVYLVPESHFVKTQMHLRVEPTVNRQDRHIRWAAQYEIASQETASR